MDTKLITAAILSIIGAGLIALFLGLSLYTIVLFPSLIIVLIVNIRGGQRAKAVWLGFLVFYILIILFTMIANLSTPMMNSSFIVITVFLLSLTVFAFILVFGVFFPRQEISQTPGKLLSIITGAFLILTVFVLVAEKLHFFKYYYHMSEEVRRYNQLNWPIIILSTSSRVFITICIGLLLFLREKFTFYIITPLFLVLNLIFAFDTIFHFTNDHLSHIEIMRYLSMPFQTFMEVEYLLFRIYALLALIIILYFFRNYLKSTE